MCFLQLFWRKILFPLTGILIGRHYIRKVQAFNPHIFYADDDEDDQELFRGALKEVDGSLVLTISNNGEALLELLQSPPPVPRLIFLDLNMPRKDGFETLQQLRGDKRMSAYPIVVFSTSSDPDAVRKTKEMGANLFVPKPHTYSGMKQAIQTCINMDWQLSGTDGREYLMRFN